MDRANCQPGTRPDERRRCPVVRRTVPVRRCAGRRCMGVSDRAAARSRPELVFRLPVRDRSGSPAVAAGSEGSRESGGGAPSGVVNVREAELAITDHRLHLFSGVRPRDLDSLGIYKYPTEWIQPRTDELRICRATLAGQTCEAVTRRTDALWWRRVRIVPTISYTAGAGGAGALARRTRRDRVADAIRCDNAST